MKGTRVEQQVAHMSLASIAAGTDGLLVEVHPTPDEALKDGAQSLTLEQFEQLMPRALAVAKSLGRDLSTPSRRRAPAFRLRRSQQHSACEPSRCFSFRRRTFYDWN